MITVKQRNEITHKACKAIRVLTGKQYKLKMISYCDADDKSGEFRFEVNDVFYVYFDIKLKNREIISVVPIVGREI